MNDYYNVLILKDLSCDRERHNSLPQDGTVSSRFSGFAESEGFEPPIPYFTVGVYGFEPQIG